MSSEISANARQDLNEKSGKDQDAELKVGTQHMQELEVDVGKILNDEGLDDIEGDTSPYPEVRAVVPDVDDQAIPVNTLRMWILGFAFTMIGAGINQFFSLRYPSVHIVALVAELLAMPFGILLAKILPLYTLNLGPLGKWCINPDRHFNIKEHTVVTIMSNVSFGYGSADSTSIIQAAKAFYNFDLKPGFSILIVLCCQMMGFGVAGLSSPWLVEPASIIWPGVLSNCALLSTLHSRANAIANGWKISRLRFFMYVMVGAGIWYFFPGLIFVALSYFTWVCWIAPNNLIVNHLFGMVTGLGLSPITFDWSQVAYNTNPLLSPAWAAVNVFGGFVIFFWIVTPGLYYSNVWYTAYLPLCSADVYDNTASLYNVSRIMTSSNTLSATAYAEYSPAYLPATFAFVYGISFAAITAVPVHIYLWHGTQILDAFAGRTKLDIHARLMRLYSRTPWYWYGAITIIMLALGIVMVEVYDTTLPWWAVILAVIIPAFYMIPCGIIQGITNVDANQLNVLAEFIGGYMFTGRPLANIIFKVLSTDVVGQGLYFAQDMKLGHYMKVPPRTLFFAQGSATILGALTQVGVTLWMLGNVKDICSEDQSNGFTCPNGRTTFSSSVIWGAIGPGRVYSIGKIYSGLLHFFWIGALMPVITWVVWKYWRKGNGEERSWIRLINWPLIFVGTYNVPPATGINYSSWALVNLTFNWWIKAKWFAWWSKYNYVLAAALDTGLALSAIIIFFCITYPGAQFPDWWGNTVYLNTADGNGLPWLSLPESGRFGPANGTWS
ncbi:hypothetical protein BELL_0649g00070 [Botrytis elliptica]|uniref:OPT family small oligopeptide transporter n=1 Tax=Botrytis elliptica TaxID=278938 RepID=A0A4Z1JB52_9HELO|nr:hypothetical protein BELL_0649g00070 [Botrytis elliptica]